MAALVESRTTTVATCAERAAVVRALVPITGRTLLVIARARDERNDEDPPVRRFRATYVRAVAT
jgi:hypothetical protein